MAHANVTNHTGINAVRTKRLNVNGSARYWRSTANKLAARGSGVAGAGNQNMLEVTATIVSTTPQRVLLYAK
jgi:hypothetical protein